MAKSFGKLAYSAPRLLLLGTFEEMTQQSHHGEKLDGFFCGHHAVKCHFS